METHLLCASSDDERKAWLGAIKQVMYGHKGGGTYYKSVVKDLCVNSSHNPLSCRRVYFTLFK